MIIHGKQQWTRETLSALVHRENKHFHRENEGNGRVETVEMREIMEEKEDKPKEKRKETKQISL